MKCQILLSLFLPTYLEGGNGVDNGDVEILTTPVGDFIAYGDNARKCFGVVGSGNRNFNNQYCLTAKQYSQRFGFPVLADFEMRGMLGRYQEGCRHYCRALRT